jgi:hypothetical protein
VEPLGANTHGRVLAAGRVPDCCLGLLLGPGTTLYALVTGHPDRQPHDLVFLRPHLSCAPGPMTPGIASASTRRRSRTRSLQAGP